MTTKSIEFDCGLWNKWLVNVIVFTCASSQSQSQSLFIKHFLETKSVYLSAVQTWIRQYHK